MSKSHLYVPLLGAAVFVYAWGPHPQASERTAAAGAPRLAHAASGVTRASRQQAGPLAPTLAVAMSGQDVRLALQVVNMGKRRIEVRFPDARTHDFVVLDSSGREVWRWSEGRMFTQTMQNRVVDSREAIGYDASWRPARSGRYLAIARLASMNHPLQARATFQVP